MALLPILTYPHPVLKEVAEPVTVFDDALRQLVSDMAETMYAAPGIGLAANQVGVAKRLFIVDVADEEEPSDLRVFVNPELTDLEGQVTFTEGCLSFPGAAEDIKRAERIHVRAQNERGETFEIDADGLLAIAIQHENDHINGITMIDKVGPIKKRKISRQVQEAVRASAE